VENKKGKAAVGVPFKCWQIKTKKKGEGKMMRQEVGQKHPHQPNCVPLPRKGQEVKSIKRKEKKTWGEN